MTASYNWPSVESMPEFRDVMYSASMNAEPPVKNVWKWDMPQQMALLASLAKDYRYITVDCRFPGIVARPIGSFHTTSEFHYQTLRTNVDLLKVVQIGLTLTDAMGNIPPGSTGSWQFNFKFDTKSDMCSAIALEILRQSGFDFNKHETDGIEHSAFAELLLTSGLVLSDQITWVSFHSGYDLGFLVSMMQNRPVPSQLSEFSSLVGLYFPLVWDVKTLVKSFKMTDKNFLHDIAQDFGLFRGSPFCLAGADSRLAALCFFEVFKVLGDANVRPLRNVLFGLVEERKEEDDELAALNLPVAPRMVF